MSIIEIYRLVNPSQIYRDIFEFENFIIINKKTNVIKMSKIKVNDNVAKLYFPIMQAPLNIKITINLIIHCFVLNGTKL